MPVDAKDQAELHVVDTGDVVLGWHSYQVDSDFLSPSDSWQFATGDARVVGALREKLQPGAKVQIVVGGTIQSTGLIDHPHIRYARGSGVQATFAGRDLLGQCVDASVDPRMVVTPAMTIGDLFQKLFGPFGFGVYSTTDIFNRRAMSGINPQKAGQKVVTPSTATPGGSWQDVGGVAQFVGDGTFTINPAVTELYDPTAPKSLQALTWDQFRPHDGEGVYEFAARIVKRFGYQIWLSADGETLIVDAPDFKTPAVHRVVAKASDPASNVLDGDGGFDYTDQPSVVLAWGSGGGGANDRATLKCAMVNELTGLNPDGTVRADVQTLINGWKGANVLPVRDALVPYAAAYRGERARPQYVKDDEAKNAGQLEAFVRRTMAQHQRRALAVSYTVEGHAQSGAPWLVNTLVDVDDDVLDLHEPLWALGRSLLKGRPGGTTTKLTLIRRHTLDLLA